jgi:hypothetical protein
LLLQTIEAIATLNEMIPPGEFDVRPAPIVVGIMYNEQAELVIELSAVSPHVVALWRWLTKTIPADARSAGPYTEQPAGERPGSPGEMRPGEDESPRPWFRLQVQPGQIAGMVKFYVKRTMGKALDARELEPLVRAIVHLAELRINCQLRLRQGAS